MVNRRSLFILVGHPQNIVGFIIGPIFGVVDILGFGPDLPNLVTPVSFEFVVRPRLQSSLVRLNPDVLLQLFRIIASDRPLHLKIDVSRPFGSVIDSAFLLINVPPSFFGIFQSFVFPGFDALHIFPDLVSDPPLVIRLELVV